MKKENNTLRKKINKNKTIKNKHTTQLFMRKFIKNAFEILMTIKLYHWKTNSYSQHKATDELYSLLNNHMDQFVEVLMGKTNGMRANFINTKNIKLVDINNKNDLSNKINYLILLLSNISNDPFMKFKFNSDLLNIRDEIVADLNKFLYLLTLN